MKKREKQVRSRRLKKLMRFHFLLTGLFLSVYFLVAFFDPGFLSYDLRQKYNALANGTVTLTATVLDVPVKPVVSGTSQCSSGVLSVALDWADDVNTFTYDITRDGLPLVSGISLSQYSDTNVALGTTYEYVVTAHGPMGPGFATSDPLSVTTLSLCQEVVVAPAVNITSFDGQSIDSYDGIPSVTTRRPIFTGTTNMPNAIIQVVVGPPSNFLAQFTANANGYFAWQPPFDLSLGTQVFTVTAIDPNDALRQSSASLQFEIRNSGGAGGSGHPRSSKKSITKTVAVMTTPSSPSLSPVVKPEVQTFADFSLSVGNYGKKVFQGESLNISLFLKDVAQQYEGTMIPLRFSIVDAKGNIISSSTSEELFRKGMAIQKQLDIPAHMQPGTYSVQVEVLLGETNISRFDGFTVAEVPLISLGGGAFVTYAEVVRNLGWVSLSFFVLLSLWIFLFLKEYGMYLHALRHITEQQLANAGFMTKRKGGVK